MRIRVGWCRGLTWPQLLDLAARLSLVPDATRHWFARFTNSSGVDDARTVMKQFINYKKRSVKLPAGCKDLIDVLHLAKQEGSSTFTSQTGGLADVAKHLSALLKPGAKSMSVAITWHQMNYLHLMN